MKLKANKILGGGVWGRWNLSIIRAEPFLNFLLYFEPALDLALSSIHLVGVWQDPTRLQLSNQPTAKIRLGLHTSVLASGTSEVHCTPLEDGAEEGFIMYAGCTIDREHYRVNTIPRLGNLGNLLSRFDSGDSVGQSHMHKLFMHAGDMTPLRGYPRDN